MKSKWILSLLLAALLVAPGLTACANEQTQAPALSPTQAQPSTTSTTAQPTASGTEKSTIRLALQTNSNITDYEDNAFTQLLEQEGNVEFQFEFLPSAAGDVKNKITLMIAGGDTLPDVFCTSALDDNSILDYGSKGAFLAVEDWMADSSIAVNFNNIESAEDKAKMLADVRSADGHVYGLPLYAPSPWSTTTKRLYFNAGWANKLGLDIPTTTDELHQVLKAFVAQDPNGNGIADELGLYGMSSNETILALMNSFIYTNGLSNLALNNDGSMVTAPFVMDGFREGLTWMNQLYNDGLITENMFTDDRTTMIATMNGDANVVGLIGFGSFPTLWPNSALGKNENVKDYDIIAPLKGPQGLAYSPKNVSRANGRWFITKDAADPQTCLRVGDLGYRRDISIRARYGKPENVITDPKELEAGGWTNSYKEMGIVDHLQLRINVNINATSTNEYWTDIFSRYMPEEFDLSYSAIVENDDTTSTVSTFHGKNYLYNVNAHPEHLLPLIKYTPQELDQVNDIKENINNYVSANVAQFILGGRNIETEWDAYVQELEKMGLATYLEVTQAVYDRTK